jgi:ankyrin repeat protein
MVVGRLENKLFTAAKKGDVCNLRIALEMGANINALDNDGNTALILAVNGKNAECVWMLMLHGASKFIPNKLGFTPQQIALTKGAEQCARLIETTNSCFVLNI